MGGGRRPGAHPATREGLKEAMAGAQVVIDLANSPSFEDKAVLEFFGTSSRNLLAAEAANVTGPHYTAVRDALDHWRRGAAPPISVHDCARAVRLIDQAYEYAG
jgi:hypothetical protein